ncbi:hypothetical protein ACFFX0_27600 [Citricoccus parietis]|uniref:Uncharacterized protein n=1 Tax=Citricoccus parietis TaxID=592307 RepID=A0ABV5G725_9MICC
MVVAVRDHGVLEPAPGTAVTMPLTMIVVVVGVAGSAVVCLGVLCAFHARSIAT